MKSQTSLIASQCRLQQWAKQIQDCQNRPVDMQVAEWCEMNGITTSNYYYRLRRGAVSLWKIGELLFSYKVHLKMCDLILTEYYFSSIPWFLRGLCYDSILQGKFSSNDSVHQVYVSFLPLLLQWNHLLPDGIFQFFLSIFRFLKVQMRSVSKAWQARV